MLGWRPPAARGPFVSFYGYRLLFRSHTWTSQGSSAGHRFQCRQNVNREGVSGQDTAFFSFRLPRAFLRYSGCLGAFLTIPMDWDHPMRDPGRIRWVAPKARNLAIGVILLVTGHGGWRHFSPLRVFGARFSEGFGLRGMLAPSLGRPQLRFGREGFPQVQILEDRSASAKPLRETPPPCDNLLLLSQWSTVC
jgi:hypothetical protein